MNKDNTLEPVESKCMASELPMREEAPVKKSILNHSGEQYSLLLEELQQQTPLNMNIIDKSLGGVTELHLSRFTVQKQFIFWERLSQGLVYHPHVRVIFSVSKKLYPWDSSIFKMALSVCCRFNRLHLILSQETQASILKKRLKAKHIEVNHLELSDFNTRRDIKQKELMKSLGRLNLQEFTIHYGKTMDAVSAKALSVFLSTSHTLRKLNITLDDGFNLSAFKTCLEAIAKNGLLIHLSIVSTYIFYDPLRTEFMQSLADVLNRCRLRFLQLSGINIEYGGIKTLAARLVDNYTLRELDLSRNDIDILKDDESRFLGYFFQAFHALEKLNLSYNRIRNFGLKSLAPVLVKMPLNELNLSSNLIDSMDDLREFLPMASFRKLNILGNVGKIDMDSRNTVINLNGALIHCGTSIPKNKVLNSILSHLSNTLEQDIFPAVLFDIIIGYVGSSINTARFANFVVILFNIFLSVTACSGWGVLEAQNQYYLDVDNEPHARQATANLRRFLNAHNIKDVAAKVVRNRLHLDIAVEKIINLHAQLFPEKNTCTYTNINKMCLFYKKQYPSVQRVESCSLTCMVS